MRWVRPVEARQAVTTAAVILAAGGSTRLGEPKQLLRWRGATLLEHAVRTAVTAGLEPVIVVLGAGAARISEESDLRRAWVVVNPRWAEGMAGSVRAGVELAQSFAEVGGVVLLTSDMPGVEADHLRALVEAGEAIAGSAYAGRVGVPAFFGREHFAALLQLEGDAGARDLLRAARSLPLSPEAMHDVDTPEDVARLRSRESGGGVPGE